jgi:hypothetical protein
MEDWLTAPPAGDFWSDAAFGDRWLEGSLENLRHLGLPPWFLRGLRRLHTIMSALRKGLRGLAIQGTKRQ